MPKTAPKPQLTAGRMLWTHSRQRQDVWPCSANTSSPSVEVLISGWLSRESSAPVLLDGSK